MKLSCRLAFFVPLLLGLFACGGTDPDPSRTSEAEKPQQVATVADEKPSDSDPFAAIDPAFLRGRVIDTRTEQGVGELWVRLRRRGAECLVNTDRSGYFAADRTLPDGMVSALVGLSSEGPWLDPALFRLQHDEAGAADQTHVLRVGIGPSYFLDFLSTAREEPERWEARLVEKDAEQRIRHWSWQVLRRGELPLLRYPTVEHEPSPRFSAQVELRLRGGDWFGRTPVNSTVGDCEEPVRLRLVQYAAFGGRVVDSEGVAVTDAEVALLQKAGSVLPPVSADWRIVYSGEDGSFGFKQELEPGIYHLRLASQGRAGIVLELELEEGGLSGYELLVPALEIAGEVGGMLRRSGEDSLPVAILSLRSTDDAGVALSLHPGQQEVPWGAMKPVEGGVSFLFDRVPAGRYELTLFPLDGRDWQPLSLEVVPPLDELVFECGDDAPRGVWRFVLLDAKGAGELGDGQITLRTESWWSPEASAIRSGDQVEGLPLDSPLTWIVHAPGYRPAYGALADSEGEGDQRRFLVELEPGWGAELWLRDARGGGERPELDSWTTMARVHQRPAVVGAKILADGQPVGVSDELGRLRFSLDEKPRRIEVAGSDWVVLDTETFRDGAIIDSDGAERRSVVLWLNPAN